MPGEEYPVTFWPDEDARIERRRFLNAEDEREKREDEEDGKAHLRHGNPGEQNTP